MFYYGLRKQHYKLGRCCLIFKLMIIKDIILNCWINFQIYFCSQISFDVLLNWRRKIQFPWHKEMDWRESGPCWWVLGVGKVLTHLNMSSPVWFDFHPNLFSAESSLLHDNVAFVLCLDTLANGDELYMHVSRPPKPDAPMHSFIQQLEEVTSFTARSKMWSQPFSVLTGLNLWFGPGGVLQIPLGEGGIGP